MFGISVTSFISSPEQLGPGKLNRCITVQLVADGRSALPKQAAWLWSAPWWTVAPLQACFSGEEIRENKVPIYCALKLKGSF